MTRLASLFLLLACLLPQPTFGATALAGDVTEFEAQLEAAEKLSLAGKWKDAREAWLVALRDHPGASYAAPHIPEVREALHRAAFWIQTSRPKVQDLVSGKLTSFSRSTGKIRIQYEPGQLDDFDTVANYLLHPLHFRGTYTVEYEASAADLMQQMVLVGMADDYGYSIRTGHFEEEALIIYYHQLNKLSDGETEMVDSAEPKKRKKKDGGKSVKVKITVSKSNVSVSYNGRKVLSSSKDSDELGQVGITLPSTFEKLSLSGIAEIAWLDDLVDASVQAEREAFDKEYKDPIELGEWLEVAAPGPRRSRDLSELTAKMPLPDKFTPGQIKTLEELTELIRVKKHTQANAQLEALANGDFPESSRLFLLVLNNLEVERYVRALEYAEELLASKTSTLEMRRITILLRIRVERHQAAIDELEALLQVVPEDLGLYVELATVLMLEGRIDDARKQVDKGLTYSPFDEELVELREQVAKASQGPSWKRSFEVEGDNTIVRSDISDRMTRIASNAIEDAWAHYIERFGDVPSGTGKLRLYLFSGESSYEAYIDGVASKSPENTAGLYSTRLKQLLVWNQPDRERLLDVVRHETMHAYMNSMLGQCPPWFGEGVSEYFAAAKLEDKSWEEGTDNTNHLLFFGQAEHELLTVEQLLFLDHPNFMLNAQYCYPMSWAFIDFLLHSTPENNALFEATWKVLGSDIDPGTATHQVFDSVDLDALNNAFWKDLKSKL